MVTRALVPALLLLPLLSWAAAAPQRGVSGAFLKAQGRRPIAGALVTLYEKGSGYLVDSTYTRDDGKFDLRPPPKKGPYLLVITQGSVSSRTELAYDPAAPGVIYSEILDRSEKSFGSKAWEYLVAGIQGAFGTIAGFVLGYYLKQWEGRKGAARTLNREVTNLRLQVANARQQVAAAIQGLNGPMMTARYRAILAEAQASIPGIDAELAKASIQDAAFELRGAAGSRDFLDYRIKVEEIRRIAGSQDTPAVDEATRRVQRLATLLGELDAHSLTLARSPWWRRIGSTS
jgi:hypothetical protein